MPVFHAAVGGALAIRQKRKKDLTRRASLAQASLNRVRKIVRRTSIGSTSSAPPFQHETLNETLIGSQCFLPAPDRSHWYKYSIGDISQINSSNKQSLPSLREHGVSFSSKKRDKKEKVGSAFRCIKDNGSRS